MAKTPSLSSSMSTPTVPSVEPSTIAAAKVWYSPDFDHLIDLFTNTDSDHGPNLGLDPSLPIWRLTQSPLDPTGSNKTTKRPNWNYELSLLDFGPISKRYKGYGIGIVPELHPRLIILDIDHTTNNPFSFRILPPTYTEYSTSKNGLRLLYFVSEATKQKLLDTGKTAAQAATSRAKKPIQWDGHIAWGHSFMLITGDTLSDTPEPIATIPDAALFSFLKNYTTYGRVKDETDSIALSASPTPAAAQALKESGIASWAQFEKMVLALPLDQNYQIQQAVSRITSKEYCHWDYWFTVGSAIHYASKRFDIPSDKAHILWLKWSQSDPTSYDSHAVEQLDRHWESFEQKFNQLGREAYLDPAVSHAITDATIIAFYNAAVIRWPVLALKSKHAPDPTAALNAFHAFKMHNLSFTFAPSKGLLISGPSVILKDCWGRFLQPNQRFFNSIGPIPELQLRMGMTLFGQSWCKLRNNTWVKTWVDAALSEARSHYFSPMQQFLQSTPDDYTEEERERDHMDEPDAATHSTFDTLWSAFNLLPGYNDPQYTNLYRKMLYRALMTMVMTGHPEDFLGDQTAFEGIPVLTGPENTGKTSFWLSLLPLKMKSFTKTQLGGITGDKPERDFGRSMSGNALVVLDEIDTELTVKSATALKKLLTTGELSFTEIYETTDSTQHRQALLVGTTNSLTMPLGDNGSRRMWIIPIESLDFPILNSISRYHLFQNLNEEYKRLRAHNVKPQKMLAVETLLVTECNKQFNATSSNNLALEELFETPTYSISNPMPLKELDTIAAKPNATASNKHDKHCWTLVEVRELLQNRGLAYGKISALKQALCALSVAYTGRLSANINGRLYKNGHLKANTARGRSYYILPALRDEMSIFSEETGND